MENEIHWVDVMSLFFHPVNNFDSFVFKNLGRGSDWNPLTLLVVWFWQLLSHFTFVCSEELVRQAGTPLSIFEQTIQIVIEPKESGKQFESNADVPIEFESIEVGATDDKLFLFFKNRWIDGCWGYEMTTATSKYAHGLNAK